VSPSCQGTLFDGVTRETVAPASALVILNKVLTPSRRAERVSTSDLSVGSLLSATLALRAPQECYCCIFSLQRTEWVGSLWLILVSLFFFFFFFKDLFILNMWTYCHCFQTHQKRASDPITDGCEPPCGCWELNSGSLERAVSALNCWVISPALILVSYTRRAELFQGCFSCRMAGWPILQEKHDDGAS
jgi:hypothetical protein